MPNQNPEQLARDRIDAALRQCGWTIQDKKKINLSAALGVAIREYLTDTGPTDYILFIDKKPVGVIETKRPEEDVNLRNFKDLKDFITLYNPKNRNKRKETWSDSNPEGRWMKFSYEDILARDKTSLDITWLKDKSLADLDNLPDPDELAVEIIENLEAGLESFRELIHSLKK